MGKILAPLAREEGPEVGNETLDFSSDTDVADASTNSSPPVDDSIQQDKKPLKNPVYGSDKGSPFMEDGLPGYDNWHGGTEASLDDDPFRLTEPAYPAFETGRLSLSTDWLQILQEGNKRYDLRDTDRSTFRGSGWQDLDKSGDYFDPDLEPARSARPQTRRIRKVAKVEDLDDCDNDDQTSKRPQPRTLSYDQGRKNGRSMYLRLKISSEGGIKKFKDLTRERLLSYEAVNEVLKGGRERSFSDSAHGGSKSPFMGMTGVTTRSSAVKGNDKTHDHPYRNSEDTYENLIGHREGRGCRDCHDLGLECSLIHDCLSYPCASCKEDEQDCIPIIPRNEKRPCEHCKRKRLQCSYAGNDEEKSIAACDNCQDANVICIAGPAKSYRIDDILASIGNKCTGSKAAAKTQYPFCTKCRRNKVRTSAGLSSQNQICRQCLVSISSPTPQTSPEPIKAEKKPRAGPKKVTTKTRAQIQPSNRRNASSFKPGRGSAKQKKLQKKSLVHKINFKFDSELESAKSNFSASVPGGRIMHITTSYCHPIQFNWVPPPPLSPSPYSSPKPPSEIRASSFPCHFCTDPGLSYAVAGLGSKRVEVIQWDHDPTAGYEELDNGWVQAGQEGTRMCMQCTMERVLICLCTDHMIRPIKGLDPRTFDFGGAIQSILNQNLNRGKPDQEKIDGPTVAATAIKWCSICIDPAFFECCVTPPFTTSGLETSPADDIGCGLLLCEVCAFRMRGRHQHLGGQASSHTPPGRDDEPVKCIVTLDQHINAASNDTFHYPDGLRADVCFLKADSELMRRQGAGGEDASGDVGNEQEIDVDEELEYDGFQDRGFKKRNWGLGSPVNLT